MANQQLVDYIKQQTQLGVSKESIKQTLMTSGWPEADVNEGFAALNPVAATPAAAVQPQVRVAPSQPVTSDIQAPASNPASPAMAAKPANAFQSKVDSYVPAEFKMPAETKTGRSWRSFLLPVVMGLVIMLFLGSTIYLYSQNSSLTGDLSKKSLSNNDISVQLSAAIQDRTNLTGDLAKSREELADLRFHLAALLAVPGASSTAVDLTLRGTLRGDDKTPYTLTTARGLAVAIKNYKTDGVNAALKPLLGTEVLISGTSAPGSKELVLKTLNNNPVSETLPPSATTTPATAPPATTTPASAPAAPPPAAPASTTTKPIMP